MDPDGRKVKNKETQQLLDKVFENRFPKILTEDFLKKVNDNSIQGRRFTKIFDLSYIGDNSELQKQAVKILKDAAESDNESVNSYVWLDGDIRIEVTEFWIVTYDSESEKSGDIYNVFVDIGNDGYIDYVEWLPISGEIKNE